MAYVCVEISCAPNGEEKYPVPTTLRIARIFADSKEAAKEFDQDLFYKAEPEVSGQDIYYLLWDTRKPLNLDRFRVHDNSISNCGMWLDDNERIFGDVELNVELIPPERIKVRNRAKAAAVRAEKKVDGKGGDEKKPDRKPKAPAKDAYDDGYHSDEDGYNSQRGASAIAGAVYAKHGGGTPWKKYM